MHFSSSVVERIRTASEVYSELASVRASLRAELRTELASYNLRPETFAAANVIHRSGGGCGNADIAEALGLPRGGTHRLLKELQVEGIIVNAPDLTDKRFNSWSVSDAGIRILDDLRQGLSKGALWRALTVLQPGDRLDLIDDLHALTRGLISPQGGRVLEAATSSLRGGRAATAGALSCDLALELCLLVLVAYRLLRGEQTSHLQAATGGTIESAHYMAIYKALEPTSVSDIAEFLRLDPATTSRVIDHLVRLGYVSRSRSATDGRQVYISSNESARQLISAVAPFAMSGDFIGQLDTLPDNGNRLGASLKAFGEAQSGRREFPLPNYSQLAASLSDAAASEGNMRATLAQADYRKAIANFATGVVLMTTRWMGRQRGITVNSLTSVSLNPPLLLVCLIDAIPMLELVTHSGRFAINILSAEQKQIASAYGMRETPENPHDLSGIDLVEGLQAPVVDDALCGIVCRVDQMLDVGDHTIVIGAPIDLHAAENPPDSALGFWRGSFSEIAPDLSPTHTRLRRGPALTERTKGAERS